MHQSNYLQSSVVLIQRFILSSLLHSIAMNTARNRQSRPFSQLTLEEKLEVKRLGLNYRRSQGCLHVVSLKPLLLSLPAFWRCSTRKSLDSVRCE